MNATPTSAATVVTRYGSYAELPESILDDALLLLETDPAVLHGAWSVEGGCAFTRRARGIGYLASIATAPESRGQGLGGAVTAALTRHAFASGGGICTLAHFHPNEPARRLYLRLGYRTTHQAQSIFFGHARLEE